MIKDYKVKPKHYRVRNYNWLAFIIVILALAVFGWLSAMLDQQLVGVDCSKFNKRNMGDIYISCMKVNR